LKPSPGRGIWITASISFNTAAVSAMAFTARESRGRLRRLYNHFGKEDATELFVSVVSRGYEAQTHFASKRYVFKAVAA